MSEEPINISKGGNFRTLFRLQVPTSVSPQQYYTSYDKTGVPGMQQTCNQGLQRGYRKNR